MVSVLVRLHQCGVDCSLCHSVEREELRGSMLSTHDLNIVESCLDCKLRDHGYFCDLLEDLLEAFDSLNYSTVFPKGAMLFILS